MGNQEILPYEGYTELEVPLANDTPANDILVPFLITPERLPLLILGTNRISCKISYRISCKLHPCRETPRIIKYQDTKTSYHYTSRRTSKC